MSLKSLGTSLIAGCRLARVVAVYISPVYDITHDIGYPDVPLSPSSNLRHTNPTVGRYSHAVELLVGAGLTPINSRYRGVG